jgi:hypothetical protein
MSGECASKLISPRASSFGFVVERMLVSRWNKTKVSIQRDGQKGGCARDEVHGQGLVDSCCLHRRSRERAVQQLFWREESAAFFGTVFTPIHGLSHRTQFLKNYVTRSEPYQKCTSNLGSNALLGGISYSIRLTV